MPNSETILDEIGEGKIPTEFVEYLKGKKFKVLEYVKENGYYDSWNGMTEGFPKINLFDVDTDVKQIIEEFKKKNKSAYPTKYNPSGLKAKEIQDEIPDEMPI